jgi:hypothetical protein
MIYCALKSRVSDGHYMKSGIYFCAYLEHVKYLSERK